MGSLALPSYGNQLDVYHEDKLDDIIVLDQVGSPVAVTLIVWEDVADTDQRALRDVLSEYGSPVLSGGRQDVKLDTQLFTGSPHRTGLRGSSQYTVSVDVTGPGSPNSTTTVSGTIAGSAAQTFPRLASALTAVLTDVNVNFVNGNALRFSTTAVGSDAKIEIGRFGTLLNPASPLLGFFGFKKSLVGASTRQEILELNRTDANVLFSDKYSFIIRKRRPFRNVAFEISTGKVRSEYFDTGSNSFGSPSVGVWRLLGTNALSGSPNTSPSWLLP